MKKRRRRRGISLWRLREHGLRRQREDNRRRRTEEMNGDQPDETEVKPETISPALKDESMATFREMKEEKATKHA